MRVGREDAVLPGSAAGTKVLIVDDDFRNIFALTALLERGNLEVIPAESGPTALELLDERSDIDIVLMDIMMPVMNGYETMAEIRERPRYADLPIIAVTSKVMRQASASAASRRAPTTTSPSPSTPPSCWQRSTSGSRAPQPDAADATPAALMARPGWRQAESPRRSWSSTTTRPSASRSSRCSSSSATTTVEADSGEAALRAVMERTFAVILMDVQMPA